MPPSASALASEYLALVQEIDSYTDDTSGPWLYADGRTFPLKSRIGSPPERHPRRCHARSWRSKKRCGRWAETGRDYCKFHGGRQPQCRPRKDLPAAYAKHLRPTLAARLQEYLQSDRREEQLKLYEEVALARVLLTESLDLMTALQAAKAPMDQQILMASQVRIHMDQVADLCGRCAKIEKDLADVVSVGSLGMFVEEVTRAIYSRLGDSPTAKELALDLRRLQLPEAGRDTNVPLEVVLTYDDE